MFTKRIRVYTSAFIMLMTYSTSTPEAARAQASEYGNFSGAYGSASGVQRRDTDRTFAQAWQDDTPDVNQGIAWRQAPGFTFRTGTGTLSAGDFNGPDLRPEALGSFDPNSSSNLPILSTNSTSDLPIPSGDFTLGFSDDVRPRRPSSMRDPGSEYRNKLPQTSTSSVAFDIVEHFEPNNDSDPALFLESDGDPDAVLAVGGEATLDAGDEAE